jgi:uncharacterized protein involved in outer membrane biogenesis
LAVAAALIAPSFIDWNAYRAEIAAEVRKATGRTLAIDGGIDVAVLPAPKLTLAKARLSNIEGATDADMVRLASLDLRVALWPLLSGKVVVQSVVLRGADIRLEKLADGRENWSFDKPRRAPSGTVGGQGAEGQGGGAGRGGDSVSLQQVIIESSALSFRDSAKGTVRRVDGVNARIAAATLSGPFVARGEFRHGGVPIGFDFRSGRIESGASTKVVLEARFTEAKAKLSYTGLVTPGTPSFTVTGKLTAQGPDFGALVAAFGRAAGGDPAGQSKPVPALAQPFNLTAGITGGSDSLSLNDIAAEMGGTRVSGAVNIAPGAVTNVDGTFKMNRLDLDRWLAGAGTAPAVGTAGKGGAKAAKSEFSFPRELSVSLDAGIDGIVFRKGLIRDLKARVLMDKGALRIKSLSARLPGGSEARVSGRLQARKGMPRFDGRVRLDSSDFRAVVRWLGGDDGALPRDRLRKVRFRAGLGYEPQRIEFRDMDLRFDASKVTGGMVVALRERIGIGARLKVDRLNLDAYLPKKGAAASGATIPGAKPAAAPGTATGLAALGTFDANLNITAGRLTYGGEHIRGLAMEGTLVGGDLTLRKLSAASFAGARVDAKGVVRKLDKSPVPDVKLRLSAKDPRRLFRLSPFPIPAALGKLGPLTVDGRLIAERARTRIDLDITAGKIKLGAKGTLAGLGVAPRVDLDFRLGHPDFVTFVRLFDPGFKPEKRARGPFSVAAKISGAGLDFKLDKFAAQLGKALFTGAATLSLAAVRPLLKADLKGDEIIVDHFLAGPGPQTKRTKGRRPGTRARSAGAGPPWSDTPVDIEMLKLIDADLRIQARAISWRRWRVAGPRLDLTLDNGRLDMRRLTGAMVGGSFHMTGSVAAPAKAGGAVRTRLDLDVARMDLKQAMFNAADVDIAKGKVNFKISLSGRGATSRAIARSLAGSGSLSASEGAVSGFDLARVNERISRLTDAVSLLTLLQTAMAGGTTRFSKLNGTFAVKGGVLRSNDVSIIADGGTGAGKLMVDMGRWVMDGDVRFRLSGNAGAPPFDLVMKGPLDSPRRIIKANALQAWLANRAAGALVNQFLGKPKQDGSSTDGGTPASGSQPQPSSKDQFIKGIFDLLKQ